MRTTIIRLTLITCLVLGSIGCHSRSIETASGKECLNKYQNTNHPSLIEGNIDEKIREVAGTKPSVQFPARIGLVKLYNGKITNLTAEEIEAWNQAKRELGEDFGEFVPLSSMIVVHAIPPKDKKTPQDTSQIFSQIRLGAAGKHFEQVLIYEVFSKTKTTKLSSAVADWTIVGGYFVPSRQIDTIGYANALLLDVRSGYPYGTASTTLNTSKISTTQTYRDESRNLADQNEIATAIRLIPQTQKMIEEFIKQINKV
jgi:hypothetical protein